MANNKQYSERRDKVLMQLCKKAARKKGLDPDEPSYKAYCSRLYNQTMQGKGLSGLASDMNIEQTADRLRSLFSAIGFPYEPIIDGDFIDYLRKGSTTTSVITEEQAEALFYKQFGRVVNFEKLVSQFWDNDNSVKAWIDSVTSSAPAQKEDQPEPSAPAIPSSRKRLSEADGKFQGEFGGLKFKTYSAAEGAARTNNLHGSGKLSSIRGLTGQKLIELFGYPTEYDTFKNTDDKSFGFWLIDIEDLGIFEIHDYKAWTPIESGDALAANSQKFLENDQWSISFWSKKPVYMLDEKECDHASHFFGDTAFQEKVEFPFVGCEENPTQPTTKPSTIWERYSDPGSEWSTNATMVAGDTRLTVRTLVGATYHLDLYYDPLKTHVGNIFQSGSDPLYLNVMGIFGKYDSNEPITQDGYVFYIVGVKAVRVGTNESPTYYYYSVRTHTKMQVGSVFNYYDKDETNYVEACAVAEVVFSDPILRYRVSTSCGGSESTDAPPTKEPKDTPDKPKRGRGRPPGAKNKPKDDSPKPPKRGRGRPPGAKNKPKDSEKSPEESENKSELPPFPVQPEEKNEERPQSKPYDENPETATRTDFLMKVGSDIFQKLEVGDDDATQKVYDWFASAPDDVSGLITDEQMMTVLDLLLKD